MCYLQLGEAHVDQSITTLHQEEVAIIKAALAQFCDSCGVNSAFCVMRYLFVVNG